MSTSGSKAVLSLVELFLVTDPMDIHYPWIILDFNGFGLMDNF